MGLPKSAYIHIPFCRRRCFYCDFPISVVGDRRNGSNSGTIARYVEVLCREIRGVGSGGGRGSALCLPSCLPRNGESELENQDRCLETVFFGGGTPSLLSVEQLSQILAALDRQFGIAAKAEISMEIDPGTFDLAQLKGYQAAGVNRVSLGVQAFQPELLQLCGRSHTVADIDTAIAWIHQAEFTNFSLDLISGLPKQTLEDWQTSLERAIALAPTHLSCYDLTVESGTPFSRQYKPGEAPLPSDELTAEMYRMAQQMLTVAGYEHYEISNYAKSGYQCRHNRTYWENHPFHGFGMGATSYLGGDRYSRPRKTQEYYAWVEAEAEGDKGDKGASSLSSREVLLDTLMLGFRLAEGLDLAELLAQFGKATVEHIWNCLRPYRDKGWIEVIHWSDIAPPVNLTTQQWLVDDPASMLWDLPQSGRLRLSDPEGFLYSNVVLVSLFEQFE